MNRFSILILLLSCSFFAQAQNKYFQQTVNYKIEVSLDDVNHTLTGNIDIEYTNNAPYALESIYFHLWPNAYSNKNTAFARQKIFQQSEKFYYAKEADMGNIGGLAFTSDNQALDLSFPQKDNPDIAIVKLNKPLPTGATITISTPFTVKIPRSFSRFGHEPGNNPEHEETYQITQWYPKPAVLDRYGWHPMPYLDQGEFYSGFGNFDVTINLPSNYVVGATGLLQTASEIEFLNKQVELTQQLKQTKKKKSLLDAVETYTDIKSIRDQMKARTGRKTIQYTAKKVHDFAWFADQNFLVGKSKVSLASGKEVTTWAMWPMEGWAKGWGLATTFLNRSVKFYSEHVGEYPYPQATAVMSALSAGAGMEYPMITVIGNESGRGLDNVITHEVGHNWFYGILASNERSFSWMDEGMNSYYEQRYMNKYYPPSSINENRLLYVIKSRLHEDQSPSYPVTEMSSINYGLSAYAKPAIALEMLENLVGTDAFDKTMKEYYDTWKFKHPNPNDFKNIWEKSTNKNLDWFFNGVVGSTKQMDYKIQKVTSSENKSIVHVENMGELKGPLLLYGLDGDNEVMDSIIIDGFVGAQVIELPKNNYAKIQIDPYRKTLDVNAKNNSSFRTPTKLKFGFGMNNNKKYHFWIPSYGWNKYDKSMLGFTFYNEGQLTQKLYYEVTPMYSFGTKTLVGKGLLEYPIYPKGFFHKILPSISFKRFSYFQNEKFDYQQTYSRVAPSIRFYLPRKKDNQDERYFGLRHEIIQTEVPVFETGSFKNLNKQLNQYSQLFFSGKHKNLLRGISYFAGLEYAQYQNYNPQSVQYLKADIKSRYDYYYRPNKSISIGIQGQYFLKNDKRYSNNFNDGITLGSLSAIQTGRDDYAFRNLYLGRNEQEGFLSQQMTDNAFFGLKTPVLNSSIGRSNDWMTSINFLVCAPIKLPSFINLNGYFDAIFYGAPTFGEETKLGKLYSGGLQLDLKFVKINFPLFNDQDLNNLLKQRNKGNYFGRISYQISLDMLSPKKIQKSILNQMNK